MAVAGVGDRVAVDPERPLLPGLAQALELESESVEILPGRSGSSRRQPRGETVKRISSGGNGAVSGSGRAAIASASGAFR
ncbi:MAG: hypothetical protein L6W00_05530 [Lentisphaeria bacterium]|nr:MAG: hypothetical protein L6W00_05530 [Lentisphaeria bacterium]